MIDTDADDPPARTLRWVAEACDATTAHVVRRLAGGTHASTHLVGLGPPAEEVVLRRFPAGDPAVAKEVTVLGLLDGLGGLAPRLLAADPDGTLLGRPTIVVTRVPGDASITPAEPYRWAAQLGEALARVHDTPLPAGTGLPDRMARAAERVRSSGSPATAAVLAGWRRLIAPPPVLTHADYWSGNTVWTGDRLTGVVDWGGGCAAPRGYDLAWCRQDLVLLYDRAVADACTAAYRRQTGPVDDLRLWDLFAAALAHRDIETWSPNYAGLGRADLTGAVLRRRLTSWTDALLR